MGRSSFIPARGGTRTRVIYELHERVFRDGNGDGIGDFKGLTEKLDYLQSLGVTALWLLPFYPSPLRDDGYDISDYRQVHPSYGTTARLSIVSSRDAPTRHARHHQARARPHFRRAPLVSARAPTPSPAPPAATSTSGVTPRTASVRPELSSPTPKRRTGRTTTSRRAYYWHRFFSGQPSLNYDSPLVRQEMFDVVDYWLSMGVDGIRLDAVPYLYARDGTSCENLPEVFDFLRDLRAHVDRRFDDRMILAEANQWPEDAVAYMGRGDMCHMAYHFPLMPRMFMAARQEDRFPMVDILAETPSTPPDCQWALFLRNHDELTLEMVTDEERDYMYRVYAQDPQARINVGIRRRLAPLLGNDRALIEMMNGLLFSLHGTPIIYYGDEIGMGDNIYLGDRNAVRTPMQWDSDRNAGFSDANPQRLYLPTIIDPEYHYQAINVEAEDQNPSSLLWWMRRLVALRQRYQVFGRGTLEILRPDNRKIFSFIRHDNETVLCIFNLSRYVQCAELDLSEFRGVTPVEMFGNQKFPSVGDLPYFITLGPHGFYWFLLESEPTASAPPRERFDIQGEWDSLFTGVARRSFENFLMSYLSQRRWFTQKARTITATSIIEVIPVPMASSEGARRRNAPSIAQVLIVNVDLDFGGSERYVLSLAHLTGTEAEEFAKWHADGIVADIRISGVDGLLIDATYSAEFVRAMADMLARRRALPGIHGRLLGVPASALRDFDDCLRDDCPITTLSAEQSNSSVLVGQESIFKFIRRFEQGVNPEVEVGRFLDEQARFPYSARVGGSVEYLSHSQSARPATLAVLEEFIPHESDGWDYVVDALAHGLEEAVAHRNSPELHVTVPEDYFSLRREDLEPAHPLVGPHLEWASLLGERTADLHQALTSATNDPNFAPEALTSLDRQSLFHGARTLTRQVLREVASLQVLTPLLSEVRSRENEIIDRLRRMTTLVGDAARIRCHGDYHLGQVLWTGKDFVVIDFEGEPFRSLGQRRLKRPAAVDLAGMVRSLHYAGRAAALRLNRDLGVALQDQEVENLNAWLTFWHRWVSGTFLNAYLDKSKGATYLPRELSEFRGLFDFFLLEKAIYELNYEANARPTWVDIPARGILDILDSPS